jgi:hypothetical protein
MTVPRREREHDRNRRDTRPSYGDSRRERPSNHRPYPPRDREARPPPPKEPSRKEPSPKIIVDAPPKFDINKVGPHPGFIEPCRRFVYEHQIQRNLKKLGTDQRDEMWRIQGVHFIDSTRMALGLPTKTLNTASVFYHRFRLQYSLDEYAMHVSIPLLHGSANMTGRCCIISLPGIKD